MWMPLGVIALGVVVLVVLTGQWLAERRKKPSANDKSSVGASRISSSDHLQSQLLEVKKLARSVADDLDARAERLEQLIQEADLRLARLERMAVTNGQSPSKTNREQATTHTPDDLSQRVYALADQGHNSVRIAQTLGEHVGKVELILALRGA